MWRHKPNKRDAQIRHAKRRASQRYGLTLGDNDLIRITRMIQCGEGTLAERVSVRMSLWDIVWAGIPVRIAYDHERSTPVSFLYRDKSDYDDAWGIYSGDDERPDISMGDAMSMYTALMGENPAAEELLKILGLDKRGIPRYRDCWVSQDRTSIHLLTRTGGRNRNEYLDENDRLRRVEGFLLDYDDEADPTFLHFVYELGKHESVPIAGNDPDRGPANLMRAITLLKEHGLTEPHPNPKLEAIRQGATAVIRRIFDAMGNAPSGTIVRVGEDGSITKG